MSAPLLAQALGGDVFFAFISAIAFATILAVVAGLTISASTSFAHDFWTQRAASRHASARQGEEVRVARDHGVRRRRDLDRDRDRAGPDMQRRVPGGARVRGGRVGEPAGDRAVALLAALQHGRRGLRLGDRASCRRWC